MGSIKTLGIPKDVYLGAPIITAIGACEVYVENFKSILEYNCDCVRLVTKKGIVAVRGNRLVVDYYDSEGIHIVGLIKSIEL